MSGPIFKDRVKETTSVTGTGTATLLGAVAGHQAFSAIGNGNTCYYCIEAVNGSGVPTGEWEVGIGTYTLSGTTLSRTTVRDSSNAGALVSFSAGTKNVFLINPSSLIGTIVLQDQKASGTSGGTFTAGAFRTRDLTKIVDTNGDCSLSSNQMTLAAGTYEIWASCPCANVNAHQTRLRNVTDSVTLVNGSSGYANSATVADTSFIVGRFTIAAGKALEIQHICQATAASVGFGGAVTTGEVEVYTQVILRRVA